MRIGQRIKDNTRIVVRKDLESEDWNVNSVRVEIMTRSCLQVLTRRNGTANVYLFKCKCGLKDMQQITMF